VCEIPHSYKWHDSFLCVTWLNHVCGTVRWCVWRDSFIYMTCLNLCVWHTSFICVTCLVHLCDVPHSHAQIPSFMCVQLMSCTHIFDVHHSYVWHASFVCVTWLIQMCVTGLIQMCKSPTSFVCNSYLWCTSIICVTCLSHLQKYPHAHAEIPTCTCRHALIHVCAINTRDSFICVKCLMHTLIMSQSCVP